MVPVGFHGLGERDVVDERMLDRFDAADSLQRLAANQYRPSGRGRDARLARR